MAGNLSTTPRKVLLVEMNEISWRLAEPLCAAGKLPTLTEFIHAGVRGTPVADEQSPHLDPWISWTTVYTGRPREEHGVRFLEQPPETVTGPRIWDIAADAGRSVGVYGSIMSWPPRKNVRGFWVPGTFSPGPETFPPELQPIQELNLSQTRAHTPLAGGQRLVQLLRLAFQLKRLGLRTASIAEAISFLVRSRLRPHRKWEKVSLQPLINLDFFEALYRHHRPDLATFHTNHVAHYQHRFWRAFDPTPFLVKPSAEEVRHFGPAIEFGYRVADRLLKRLWKMADDNTVVIVASGLGQQPYVVEDFAEGRTIVRVRDINQVIALCGLDGHCTPFSVMAPQWNLRVPDADRRARAEQVLASAWYRTPETKLFAFETAGDTICFNISQKNLKPLDLDAPCVIPEGGQRFPLREFCATGDATPKEGYHEREGVVVFRGSGVRRGARLNACTNLDLAPTILHLLGLPVPSYMKGRVLEEAFEKTPAVSVPQSVAPTPLAV
jgi:hypothetical protein